MDIQSFLKQFEQLFDEVTPGSLTEDTRFRDIDEWSSLTALSMIALVDELFGVALNGEDVRRAETIRDIFEIIPSKA
jgi:acyl carrier protein